eukprot:scaffold35779_cov36-Tisochrysis_lutea.AAC.3
MPTIDWAFSVQAGDGRVMSRHPQRNKPRVRHEKLTLHASLQMKQPRHGLVQHPTRSAVKAVGIPWMSTVVDQVRLMPLTSLKLACSE